MKTEEDEAFDDLAKRQGAWGGGFQAKRAAAADKLQEHWRDYFVNCKHCGREKLIQRGNHHPWCACLSDEFDWGNQRLAQPAQEPFGWYSAQEDEFMTHKIRKEHERLNSYTHINGDFDLALYTTPPAAQPAQEPVQCLDCGSHNVGIPATYDSLINSVKALNT